MMHLLKAPYSRQLLTRHKKRVILDNQQAFNWQIYMIYIVELYCSTNLLCIVAAQQFDGSFVKLDEMCLLILSSTK
jgi:hypothetical protein